MPEFEQSAATAIPMVEVHNNTGGAFTHGEWRLEAHDNAIVPKDVADIWLSHRSFMRPSVVLASQVAVGAVQAVQQEKAKLSEENTALLARVKALEGMLEAAKGGSGAETIGEALTETIKAGQKKADSKNRS